MFQGLHHGFLILNGLVREGDVEVRVIQVAENDRFQEQQGRVHVQGLDPTLFNVATFQAFRAINLMNVMTIVLVRVLVVLD